MDLISIPLVAEQSSRVVRFRRPGLKSECDRPPLSIHQHKFRYFEGPRFDRAIICNIVLMLGLVRPVHYLARSPEALVKVKASKVGGSP
jgi:hypothetical protein